LVIRTVVVGAFAYDLKFSERNRQRRIVVGARSDRDCLCRHPRRRERRRSISSV